MEDNAAKIHGASVRTTQLPAWGCGTSSPGGEPLTGILQQVMPQTPGSYFPACSGSVLNCLKYIATGFFLGEGVIIRWRNRSSDFYCFAFIVYLQCSKVENQHGNTLQLGNVLVKVSIKLFAT